MTFRSQKSEVRSQKLFYFPLPTSHFPLRLGFSLVEVVIAIAILSVGLVGSMRVFPMGLRASHRAEQVSRATLLADRTMASTKLASWDDLAMGSSTTTEDDYTVVVTIDQPEVEDVVDPTSLKRVSVSVGWAQEGRDRTLDLVTYLRKPPSD